MAVDIFQKRDIRFSQLDMSGVATTVTHFFRELKPDGADGFTVNREAEEQGKVTLYRLRSIGTGEVFDFSDIPVKKVGGEWAITEEGWAKIRNELQAKMRVRLGRPTL